MLKRRFGVDDDYLEDLKEDLIYAKKLALDEEGRVLVWAGAAAADSLPTAAPVCALDQAPLAYTPQYLTEKILASRTTLEGERKQVTVLFADLKDSTELIRGLDRLPPEEKRLLQTAVVIGKDVPLFLLQAITELPEAALHGGLAHLQAAEFLYETRLFPDREYTFKHALTHEVGYGSLLQERRRALHARIVEAMEGLSAARLAEQVERLAHHALRGEVWDKAVVYCRQAGARAIAHSAYHEAVTSFEQALGALHRLPAGLDTQAQAIDLRFDLRNALYPLGELERILTILQDATALAEALGDQHRMGWVSAYLLTHFAAEGEPDHALASGERALAIAAALGDVDLTVTAQHYLGFVYRALGDYRQAVGFFQKNVVGLHGELLYERLGLPGLASVVSRSQLVYCLAECGDFAEGKTPAEEGVRIAEAADHPFSRAIAYWAGGFRSLCQGDLRQALPMLERALDLVQETHIWALVPWCTSYLGAAHTLAGRTTEALPLLEQAVEQAVAMRLTGYQAQWVAWLGKAYLRAGRLDKAYAQGQRALEFSRAHKERGHEAYALHLLGEIAAQRTPPDVDAAATHYRQALAWPRNWEWAPSRPTATVASVRSISRQVGESRPTLSCPLPSSCTALWR